MFVLGFVFMFVILNGKIINHKSEFVFMFVILNGKIINLKFLCLCLFL